jgi:acyl-[acyl-carrier-protein]-phospholipid O-acyltransferase/long-chain-fatty-acid--[acyl-carrier-protein] ligase
MLLGISAGLYDVPFQAFLQHRSPPKTRGSILAANNFLAYSAMFSASGIFWLLAVGLGLTARGVCVAAGLATLPVLLCILYALYPRRVLRLILTALMRLAYRVRLEGLQNVPKEGGVLLVPNHVSWIDGFLVALNLRRHVRFVVYADYFASRWTRWFAQVIDVVPIQPGKRSIVESLRAAREALLQGDVVCIFPEGEMTRTGRLGEFQPGLLRILKGADVPVVPLYLAGLWGSIFSFEGGRFFWKRPRRWPYPVTLRFGPPLRRPGSVEEIRGAVQAVGEQAMEDDWPEHHVLPRRFLRTCRRALRRPKLADSTGTELSGAEVLVRTLILRRLLRREVLADDERNVGLLLPPSVAAVLANAAVSLDRRVAVNLNYTLSAEVLNDCIAQAGLRHVLTSRRTMEKLREKGPFDVRAELVYLEDFKDRVRRADKLVAALQTWLLPAALLERHLGLTAIDPDDLLTIIFTSGATGQPKGVMLSYRNVGSNVEAVNGIIHLGKNDVLVGILPMFHSFGYTVTLWTVLTLPPKGIYHYSPLEAREIGKLCRRHGATILVATPTFLRSLLRRCEPEDFAKLEVVIAGAEKLPGDLSDAFEKKFGVRPLEGYGTTEVAPVVSSNLPPDRALASTQKCVKEGTVGPPLPGVWVKVVDLDTGEDLGVGKSGMLLVKGPNVMKGYLGQPEKTAEVLRDGWYVTGDVAMIDEDGFIRITGRLARFSKIGGEMVPHIRIEEEIVKALDLDQDSALAVVTGVPDPKKGERLVVLHTGLGLPPEELCRRLAAAGLPPLWIPSPDSFRQIREIPLLGAGKTDLKKVKAIALEQFPPETC